MVSQNNKTETNRCLTEWLAGAYGSHFECTANGYNITLFRVQKTDSFDYLYCQRNYRGSGIERGSKFEYVGTYCRADGLIYDVAYSLRDLMADGDDYETRSTDSLANRLEFHVRRTIEKQLNNDRNNLRIAELHTEQAVKEIEHFKKYTAASKAREAFLENGGDDDFAFVYQCRYEPERWTEDSLLSYIADPNGYAETEAAAYFENNQEHILIEFLENDLITAEYSVIINNPSLPVHRVKRIMQAVNSSSAKTVNVTVRIDGAELTFKTEAKSLRFDCTSHYSDYNIAAADRREFERLYGRNVHYKPEDILRIEYARRVIYSADDSDSEN